MNDEAPPLDDEELEPPAPDAPELEGDDEEPELDGEVLDGEVLEPLLPELPIEPLEELEPLAPVDPLPEEEVPAASATLDTADTAKAKTTALLNNFIESLLAYVKLKDKFRATTHAHALGT